MKTKVVIKRILAPDGRVIAEAKSVASVSGEEDTTDQVVSVTVDNANGSSSCSSHSSSFSYSRQ